MCQLTSCSDLKHQYLTQYFSVSSAVGFPQLTGFQNCALSLLGLYYITNALCFPPDCNEVWADGFV